MDKLKKTNNQEKKEDKITKKEDRTSRFIQNNKNEFNPSLSHGFN